MYKRQFQDDPSFSAASHYKQTPQFCEPRGLSTVSYTHLLIGATNDYYSAAKKKMGHSAKSAYKQARKRLEQALSVDVADATDDTTAELHAAEAAFRDQRQQILPLYKKVMDWYR